MRISLDNLSTERASRLWSPRRINQQMTCETSPPGGELTYLRADLALVRVPFGEDGEGAAVFAAPMVASTSFEWTSPLVVFFDDVLGTRWRGYLRSRSTTIVRCL